jgi:hypothetical protein
MEVGDAVTRSSRRSMWRPKARSYGVDHDPITIRRRLPIAYTRKVACWSQAPPTDLDRWVIAVVGALESG